MEKVGVSTDTLLFLISQELKIRRLFHGLQKAGIEECYFEPHLDKLILSEMGLDDGTDETLERYCKIIEKRCKKIEQNQESVIGQAWKVYRDLMKYRRMRVAHLSTRTLS